MPHNRPRNYVRDLSAEERAAVLDRNEYVPLADYPGLPSSRWPARCRLCGREVAVTLNNLAEQDDMRNWRPGARDENGVAQARRQRCSHDGGNRSPRPPSPLRYEEARAVLQMIGEVKGEPAKSYLSSALQKLRRIAGST